MPKLSGPLIEPAIATDGPLGKMVLTVLGMVAEMELGFIRERRSAGIDAVRHGASIRAAPLAPGVEPGPAALALHGWANLIFPQRLGDRDKGGGK